MSRRGREPDLGTVGGRIQAARLAAGLTQEQLANDIGVSKSAISQWESGKIDGLKADNLLNLAERVDASARWIWLGKEKDGTDIPMGKPVHLDTETSDLVETFKILEPKFRDELLGDAHKYLRLAAAQKPSKANPYPKLPPRPKKPVK